MRTVRIEEIEPIRVVDGTLEWRPVRRTLGIRAFGINAYTANAGELVVEEHDETGAGAGHHEELYAVMSGRATFTVDGQELDAPAGTLVFLDDPGEKRAAVAIEDGTTVLAIGGARDEAFRISPWEYSFAAVPAWERQDWDAAERLLREGLEQHPNNASILYNLAAILGQRGEREQALELLRRSFELEPRYRTYARDDADFEPLRADPRFTEVVGSRSE